MWDGLKVIAVVAGLIGAGVAITMTGNWGTALDAAGLGVAEVVRVPNTQCEEIRRVVDENDYSVLCDEKESDQEWVLGYLRTCAKGNGVTFAAMSNDGVLMKVPRCVDAESQKMAAERLEEGVTQEDAEYVVEELTSMNSDQAAQ